MIEMIHELMIHLILEFMIPLIHELIHEKSQLQIDFFQTCMPAVQLLIITYHDFLPTPRRGSHVKSGKTHTQSSIYTP